jgi:UPF0271 protein
VHCAARDARIDLTRMTAPARTIDLNADLGENAGDDAALLDLVTSANVVCGAHAGDRATMVRTCALAAERGVVIGAHPGYADPDHFGRRALDLPPAELAASLALQYAALASAAAEAGATVRYVKPHGALYHRAAAELAVAEIIYREAIAIDPGLRFLAPPGSVLLQHASRADHGVRCVAEGFADRAYEVGPNGAPALVDRAARGATLGHDAAVAQAVALATTGIVEATDGTPIHVAPRSLCVHGDTPGAVALAREIREELDRAGVVVRAFAA